MTQSQVATEIGVTEWTVGQWENTGRVPSDANIKKLCALFNVPYWDFLTDETQWAYEHFVVSALRGGNAPDKEQREQSEHLLKIAEKLNALPIIDKDDEEDEDENDIGITDWRNPDLFAFRSENCNAIINYTGAELLVVGPTRCGKTLRILEWLFTLCFTNPGMRILICRSKEVDLRETIKTDIKDTLLKFDLSDPLSPVQAVGGEDFFRLKIKENGSRITFGGMDRPGKILGSKYDIIYYSQMEQSTPEEFQKLKTRVSGDSQNWRDPDTDEVRYLLIGDANAAQDSHYLLERKADGLTDFINFGFHDNPLFFRNNEQTPDGDRVIGELDKSLTGIWHDRLFKSLWVSAEGVVFSEFSKERHVKAIEKPTAGRWVMAVDFGFTDPCSALLINETEGMLTVWRELYKVGLTLDDFIAEARTILAGEDVEIEAMVCDHNSEHIERLKREGFPAVHADKPMIVTGLELIRSRLVNDMLVISDRANRSPDPNIDKGCKGLIDEFGAYCYKPPEKRLGNRKDDIPVDKDNHSIDPLRYACHYFGQDRNDYYDVSETMQINESWGY